MNILYLDLAGGAAGDMLVAALLDLARQLAEAEGGPPRVDLEILRHGLRQAGVDQVRLETRRESRHQIEGCRFVVTVDTPQGPRQEAPHSHPAHQHTHEGDMGHGDHSHTGHEPSGQQPSGHAHPHRHYREIRAQLEGCLLADGPRQTALEVFDRLARAEGRVHGLPPEEVVFHEVGAQDALADVVCFAVALHGLGPERVFCSPVPLGAGTVRAAHGVIPLPAPAALNLLEGFPVVLGGPAYERTTPTGAALLAAVAMPAPDGWTAVPVKTGVGVGTLDPPQLPNLLRAVWCRQSPGDGPDGGESPWSTEPVEQAEANLDDANPEWLGYLMERLLEAGALDVAYTPAQMKKNRPGTCIQVVYPPALRAGMLELLFAESTTLGVRYQLLSRAVAARRGVVVHTPWGPVAGKAAKIPAGRGNSVWRFSPEFDSASRAARQGGVPLQQVYRAAQRAYEELQPAPDED